LVEQVSSSRSTILITGETGTGKELIAKAIHTTSPRAEQAFVPVNSGSLPSDLLESTLFGHVRGAFTSAIPCRSASPERGNTRPVWPSGIAPATPVPTLARAPGARVAASAARRS